MFYVTLFLKGMLKLLKLKNSVATADWGPMLPGYVNVLIVPMN